MRAGHVRPQISEQAADFVVLGYAGYAVGGWERQVKRSLPEACPSLCMGPKSCKT